MTKQIKQIIRKIGAWAKYNPPGSMTSRGWRLFDDEFKDRAPIRYWLVKTFRGEFMNPIRWKYESVTNWIRYRTRNKYHIVNTGLTPGYYDADSRIFHSNFNLLKDFVETDVSRHQWPDRNTTTTWCEKYMPFYRWVYPFRRPDLGIKRLEWEATLDDPNLPIFDQSPHQAKAAREMLVLYRWWTEDRPARKHLENPEYSDQGLGFMASLDDDFDKSADDYVAYLAGRVKMDEQEQLWDEEDDKMLIRLINIRRMLWC